jgi:hypothetical protein
MKRSDLCDAIENSRAGKSLRLHGLGLAVAAMTLTLVAPHAQAVFNANQMVLPGSTTFVLNDTKLMEAFPGMNPPMAFDQREMGFGEVANYTTEVATALSASGLVCGRLVFTVARYQNYWLVWRANGMNTVILYRGGLVADSSRPYVGVFFGAGNKLEIRTFNRSVAYNQYGEPIPGNVVNAWTAASIAVPTNRLSLEKNGLWAVKPDGTKSAWKIGGSGC